MSYRKLLLYSIFLTGFAVNFMHVDAQRYTFVHYGIDDGICHPFVYTINQDKNGFIWTGTGEGLCRFDGFNFSSELETDTMPTSFVRVSLKDEAGNLWFGHDDGSISFYDGNEFIYVNQDSEVKNTITDVTVNSEGHIYFSTQNKGLIRVDANRHYSEIQEPFNGKLLSAIQWKSGGEMLIGGYEGLYLYDYDREGNFSQQKEFEDFAWQRIMKILKFGDNDSFLIATEDQGIYVYTESGSGIIGIEAFKPELLPQDLRIQNIFLDSEKNLWISTQGSGVYKCVYDPEIKDYRQIINYNERNGLGSRFIRDVFEDAEGNIWIGTYGNGLSALLEEALVFYNYPEKLDNNITAVLEDQDGFWLGGRGGLLKIYDDAQGKTDFYGPRHGLGNLTVSALYLDDSGNLWIGTGKNGLYLKRSGSDRVEHRFYSENSLENTINALDGRDSVIWVATNNGVYNYNIQSGKRERFTTTEGLPHNRIRDVFVDRQGIVWFATRTNGLYSVNSDQRYAIQGNFEFEFISISEDSEGNLWTATVSDGVFVFSEDSLINYSTRDGLKSNYCYSILRDYKGNIWVGHRLGLSRIDMENDQVTVFGPESGITGDCNERAVAVTDESVVLIGTTDGLVSFNHALDRENNTPPFINITSVRVSDREYDPDEDVVLPYGIYKLRVDFIGLNYRSPETVTYQYKLDGYDEWSEPTDLNYALYTRVEDGDYTFMVRACNNNEVCTESAAIFNLKVKLPVWKTWWFLTMTFIMVVLIVFIIIKYRERKQKQFQELLQKKLDERTREVIAQKEEIEIKNKDITDSINYAQRIQASILPPISKLQDSFRGSFVFYQPRDIVSGDFYWYDRVNDDTFLIVCADSTGHGVPGAFMSMIGSTLIKDIAQRGDIRSPSDILMMLDKEISSALSQDTEGEKPNDGMDIIVAEIGLKTNKVTIASAMRPMIIYKDGEQIYVRGSRSSIGGPYEQTHKSFQNNEFRLSEGDLLYMFSDGYPDQFGGPLGKKFKMVRLKNLLRDIHTKPMDEQYHYVRSNFNLWKEDLEQVDDVLFMGLKL